MRERVSDEMNVLQKYGPEYLTFVIRDNAPFIRATH